MNPFRPIGRLVEIAVFAPIGLCSLIREQLPTVNKRLAQERQAVINRAQLAQLAVRIAADRAAKAGAPQPTVPVESPVSSSQAPEGPVSVTQTEIVTPAAIALEGGAADALPISDYESLAAIHVVHRLPTLRADELEQVRVFEKANRARRTILAKIEQLQESAS